MELNLFDGRTLPFQHLLASSLPLRSQWEAYHFQRRFYYETFPVCSLRRNPRGPKFPETFDFFYLDIQSLNSPLRQTRFLPSNVMFSKDHL